MLKYTSTISMITNLIDCTRKSLAFSNILKRAICEYKGALPCEVFVYKACPDEIMDAPLSEPCFTMRRKMLSRPDGFMLYHKLGVYVFSIFEKLYPHMEIRVRVIRARPKHYTIIDNPNINFWIDDCSLYTRRNVLRDDYHKKRMDSLAYTPVEFNYMETIAKIFINRAGQN